jgi:hypothetical protein
MVTETFLCECECVPNGCIAGHAPGMQVAEIKNSGGEGGILVTSLPATTNETYTSVIIACVCMGCKRFSSSVPVFPNSPCIVPVSHQNGITGITIRQMFSFKGMGGLK